MALRWLATAAFAACLGFAGDAVAYVDWTAPGWYAIEEWNDGEQILLAGPIASQGECVNGLPENASDVHWYCKYLASPDTSWDR